MREKVLEIRDLNISFQTDSGVLHAIRGVNLDLYKGETVAIVGESGSGKSVTVKAAMGIMATNGKIDSGTILYTYTDETGTKKPSTWCRPPKRICAGTSTASILPWSSRIP